MTATVSAATAVEASTAAMEAAITVESASTVEPAAVSVFYETAATVVAMAAPVPVAAVPAPSPASPVSWATPIAAAEPRAGADEDAAREPAGAVITVGRACVRVIPVITVSANGSCADVSWSDSYAYHNALRVRVWRYRQTKSEQSENHEVLGVSHIWAPSEPIKPFCNSLHSDALCCHRPSSSTSLNTRLD